MTKINFIKLMIAFLSFNSLKVFANKDDIVLTKGSSIGTFDDFYWGDYPYITIFSKGKKILF